jgi:hypothetical protein
LPEYIQKYAREGYEKLESGSWVKIKS